MASGSPSNGDECEASLGLAFATEMVCRARVSSIYCICARYQYSFSLSGHNIPFYSIVGAALSTDVGFKHEVFYHPEIPHRVLLVYMGDYSLAKPHSHGNAKSEKKKMKTLSRPITRLRKDLRKARASLPTSTVKNFLWDLPIYSNS